MKNLLISVFISLCLFSTENQNIYAQNTNTDTLDLNTWIDTQFAQGLDSFNIPGATIILMQGDSILHTSGYGIADVESNTPVNSETSIFGIASISKTFVGTAIMQLVEEGKIQLDGDINLYLKSFQISPDFGEPITINHLLTHTAGFDLRSIGSKVKNENDVIPLADYLRKRMPPQVRPVGEAYSYSNHGYALLGLIVEEVSGVPFDEYVTRRILEPLDMKSSGFKRQPELKNNYALSYLQKDNQLIPYELDFQLFYPAGSFSSTAADMGHYISMYLNYGTFQDAQVLASTTVVQMHTNAYKNYKKAENGWLSGFLEKRWNGLKIVSHGGDIQGFASELILIPEKNLGLFLSVNASSMPYSQSRVFIHNFIEKLWLKLMPEVSTEKEDSKIIQDIGSVAEPLTAFSGNYRYTWYAQTTLGKLAVLIGFAPEFEIVPNGDTLQIAAWNDKLIPVSDLTFYSTTYNTYRAFGRNAKGEIAYFFPDGTYSYDNIKWYEPVSFQKYWIGGIILLLLGFIIVSAIGRIFKRHKKSQLLKKIINAAAVLIILFLTLTAYTMITTDPQEFFYGIPMLLKITLVLPFLFIPLELYAVWLLIKVWRSKALSTFDLVYQTIIVVAALSFIPWLMYWNLIGFNY